MPVESSVEQNVNKLSKRKPSRLRRKRQCYEYEKDEQKKTSQNDEVELDTSGTLSKRKVGSDPKTLLFLTFTFL